MHHLRKFFESKFGSRIIDCPIIHSALLFSLLGLLAPQNAFAEISTPASTTVSGEAAKGEVGMAQLPVQCPAGCTAADTNLSQTCSRKYSGGTTIAGYGILLLGQTDKAPNGMMTCIVDCNCPVTAYGPSSTCSSDCNPGEKVYCPALSPSYWAKFNMYVSKPITGPADADWCKGQLANANEMLLRCNNACTAQLPAPTPGTPVTCCVPEG